MKQILKFAPLAAKAALFSIAIFATSCRTAELALNDDLKQDTEVLPVKGRQGLQIGQVISFGDFKTSKVKRGWTSGYSVPFIVKFNGAKEKISFQQFAPNGKHAEVALISRFKEIEYAQLNDYFSVPLAYKNYFAGSVKVEGQESAWEFIVHNVDGASRNFGKNRTIGFLRNGQTRIEITGIRELEGSPGFITQNDVYGYEFQLNGKIIGAVSTINNGKVWFKKGLDDGLRLVLASVSSGLMLRSHLEERALTMN